jgi:hypothetical protein
MNKKNLSERDICTQYITPAVQHAIVQSVEELLGLCTALESAAVRREPVLGEWVRAVVAGG